MAESTSAQETQTPHLKYFGFFHAAVLQATAYLATLYSYAKDSSGPLKPSVDNVEGTVRTVVGPVYQKIEGKPLEILQYVDSTVDHTITSTINLVESVVPQFVKEKSCQAYDVVIQAPDAARSWVADVQKQGVYGTAVNYYQKYEPVAEKVSYNIWQKFLTVPYVPQAVNFATPAAVYGAQQFNHIATVLKDKHFPLAGYIPLVPVEKIEQASRPSPALETVGAQ